MQYRQSYACALGIIPTLALLCACEFGEDAITGAGLNGAGNRDSGADSDVDVDGAVPSRELTDTGLMVRYYFDEASNGIEPNEAIDSAAKPAPLEIDYGDNGIEYVELDGQRGLRFLSPGQKARASQSKGKKIDDLLKGSPTATLEMVIDVGQYDASVPPYLFDIASDGEPNLLAVELLRNRSLLLHWNFEPIAIWKPLLTPGERYVVHAVVDTNSLPAATLYVDGQIEPTVSAAAGALEPLDDEDNRELTVGNRTDSDRSFSGIIYYASLYGEALVAEDVTNNTEVLLLNDDAP